MAVGDVHRLLGENCCTFDILKVVVIGFQVELLWMDAFCPAGSTRSCTAAILDVEVAHEAEQDQ